MSPDQRRTAIVDAVLPLLEVHGEVTTRQIAEAAGIAEGTIFRVFPDKRSLYLAAAQQTVVPPGWREEMRTVIAGRPELSDKVLTVTERLVERSRSTMLVMSALRRVLMSECAPRGHQPPADRPVGPPAFFVDAARQLHAALTELVFAPHADELAVPPGRAARALQSLVMGGWHPGATAEDQLTPAEITELCLHGVVGGER